MSTIANIYTGNSINETEKQRKYVGLSDGYNYIATKDVSFEHTINYENGVKIPFYEINFKVAYKDTPLLCIEGGSAGNAAVYRGEKLPPPDCAEPEGECAGCHGQQHILPTASLQSLYEILPFNSTERKPQEQHGKHSRQEIFCELLYIILHIV